MNWQRSSLLKQIGHPFDLCFFKNCSNNSSMMQHRGLNFRRLKYLTCVSAQQKLVKIPNKCVENPVSSRLLRKNSTCAVISCRTIKPNCRLDAISEPSKFLSMETNHSDSVESYPSRTLLHCTNFYTKRTLLQKGSFEASGHSIERIYTYKPPSNCCVSFSHLATSRQLSSVAFLNSQLLKTPSLGSQVPSRHFSLEGFYTALAQCPPVQTAQGLLLDLHQYLPWWAVIPVATLAVRSLVVLPLAVHQAQVVARLAVVNAEMNKIAPELNKEVELARKMTGWDKNQAKRVFKSQLRQIYRRAVERENCHPFKMVLLVFFQMPLWICLSVSLRNITAMAQAGYPSAIGMRSEGMLWFPDLTSPDPLLIPFMLLAVNLTLTEVHALRNVGKGGLLQKVMLNGSRLIIFVVAAAATYNPTSVAFYWLCSSSFGLFQGLLLMSPRVRRALAIPKMAHESPTPYRDIGRNLQIKITRIKALAFK